MADRGESMSSHPVRELIGSLPSICTPARSAEEAWHFLPPLLRRLAQGIATDALAVLWSAEDRRSFGPLAEVDLDGQTASRERRARDALASSALRAAFAGEVVAIADAQLDPSLAAGGAFERARVAKGARSLAALPVDGNGAAGALVVSSRVPALFTAEVVTHLRQLAAALAPFVAAARLLSQLHEQERRRRCTQAANAALAGSLDVRKIFDGIVDAVRPEFGSDVMGVELVTPDGRTSERVVEAGIGGLWPSLRQIDEYSMSTELLAGRSVLVHDATTDCDSKCPGDRVLMAAGLRSFALIPLAFPISRAERAMGLVYVAKRQPFWFDAIDVEALRGLADPITLAIHHHRRVEQSKRIAAAEQRTKEVQKRLASLQHELGERHGFERIIGRSPALREVLSRAAKVAKTETTVLVTGESGTGKELVAHAIHVASARADGPFVALNCAALPEALLESELFGHEKGAFTGAAKRKPGRFELAAGGTLFLDEVGELALPVQAKLLRVLQEREFQPVGGTVNLKSNVRLVAATNRDLAAEVARGRFREDLLYRLNVFQLHLPPLRERGDDVLILADHFVRAFEASMGKTVPGISREARDLLLAHAWPGNIRELQNCIERAMIVADGGALQVAQLGIAPMRAAKDATEGPSPGDGPRPALEAGQGLPEWERRLVLEALHKAGGNKSRAAELLGVTRSQLYTRMKRFGL